jgi:ATP-dependent DNA ligase
MLPLLYGKSKNGKIKTWSITVVDQVEKSLIITRHGYKDGKLIEQVKEVSRSTNVGKANELGHFETAKNEALSKWKKKKEEGYSESEHNISTFFGPMLALKYLDHKNNVSFPCFVQPKKDGIRCVYNPKMKLLYTRKGKVIENVPHILNELKQKYTFQYNLDGELMPTDLPFETFSGLINKKKLSDEDKVNLSKVKFIVFDIFHDDNPLGFNKRFGLLQAMFDIKYKSIELIKTQLVKSESEIEDKLKEYISEGEEGIMIRNYDGLYRVNYRSKDLLKYKLFEDSEFKITGFTEGVGNEAGCVIWICETGKGFTFNVRPRGSFEERKLLYQNGKKYIGKLLTVRYQELFEDTGIPRFVVGLGIRDYE